MKTPKDIIDEIVALDLSKEMANHLICLLLHAYKMGEYDGYHSNTSKQTIFDLIIEAQKRGLLLKVEGGKEC